MSTPPPEEVVGQYTPEVEDDEQLQPPNHSAGFDAALNDALAQLSDKWGPGKYKNIKVQYAINASVTNPGTIDTYIVNLAQ